MGKGQVWVNGQSIGRYWVSIKTYYTHPASSQLFRYNVPRSFLKATGNLLLLLEEESGDPLKITLDAIANPSSHMLLLEDGDHGETAKRTVQNPPF